MNDQNTGRPDGKYRKVIQSIAKDNVCPFCPDNLANYHKNPILIEGSHWLLSDSMYPYKNAAHHFILIHKEHIENIQDITQVAWNEFKRIIDDVTRVKELPGATLLFRYGMTDYTGASVSHLHAQIVSGQGRKGIEPIITRVG